jgi:hypothetical protein
MRMNKLTTGMSLSSEQTTASSSLSFWLRSTAILNLRLGNACVVLLVVLRSRTCEVEIEQAWGVFGENLQLKLTGAAMKELE